MACHPSSREPRLRPFGAIAVTLAALSALLFATPAVAGEGESEEADGSDETSEPSETLETLRSHVSNWSDASGESGPTTPDEVVDALGSSADAEQILDWVRSHIDFAPYDGPLRGPETLLATRSGNAVDQARLLAALFDEAKVDYRWVEGKLSESAADELLDRFAPSVTVSSAGPLASQQSTYATSSYFGGVHAHVWLEVRRDDAYEPADPVTGEKLGETEGRAETRSEEPPDGLDTELEVVVTAEREEAEEKELIRLETGFERIAYTPVHVDVEPSQVEGSSVVRVHVGGRSATGSRFVTSKVETLRVDYYGDVGDREFAARRTLFDSEASGDFASDDVVATSMLVPGWTGGAARRAAVEVFERAANSLEEGASGDDGSSEALLRAVAAGGALAGAVHADAYAVELAKTFGVRPVRSEPRILDAVVRRTSDGVVWETDNRSGRLDAVPAGSLQREVVYAYRAMYGFGIDALETAIVGKIDGKETISTRDIVQRTGASEASLVTIGHGGEKLAAATVGAAVESRLRRAVRTRGRLALAPTQAVSVGERNVFGWWSMEPNGGWVRGRRGRPRAGFVDRDRSMGDGRTAHEALKRAASVLAAGIEGNAGYEPLACRSVRDGVRAAGAACGKGGLPALDQCVGGSEGSGSDSDEIGVVGIGKASCEEQLRDVRCGVSAGRRLLSGSTSVSIGSSEALAPGRGAPAAGSGFECD